MPNLDRYGIWSPMQPGGGGSEGGGGANTNGPNRLWFDDFTVNDISNYVVDQGAFIISGGVIGPTPGQTCLLHLAYTYQYYAMQVKVTPGPSNKVDTTIGPGASCIQVKNSDIVSVYNNSGADFAGGATIPVNNGVSFWMRYLALPEFVRGEIWSRDPAAAQLGIGVAPDHSWMQSNPPGPPVGNNCFLRNNAGGDGVPAGDFTCDDLYIWEFDTLTLT